MLRLSRRILTASLLVPCAVLLPGLQVPSTDAASAKPIPAAVSDQPGDEAWAAIALRAQELRTRMQAGTLSQEAVAGELRDFIKEIKAYLLENDQDPRGWNLLASLCGQVGDEACVDQAARELLKLQPDNIQVGLQWAAHYASSARPGRALVILDQLLADKPESLMYLNAWILTAKAVDPALVEQRFEATISKPGTLPQAIAFLTAMRQSDAWRSAELSTRLLQAAPGNHAVIECVARSLRATNRFKEARALLETLPADLLTEPHVAYLYSDCHYADHDFQRAFDLMAAIDQDNIQDKPGLARRLKFLLPNREAAIESWQRELQVREAEAPQNANPRVRLMIDGTPVELELFQSEAPNTVAAFLALARRGQYNATPFGLVHTGFRSIGGTIPDRVPYTLPSECARPDARHFFSGSLAMYLPHAGRPDSANCEWGIYHFPAPHLNGLRTVFGRVTSGLDVVRAMREGARLDSVEIIRPSAVKPNPRVLDLDGQPHSFSEIMVDVPPPSAPADDSEGKAP